MKKIKTTSPAALASRDSAVIGTARNIALAAAKDDAALRAGAALPPAGELSPGLAYCARKLIECKPKKLDDVKGDYRRLFPRGLELEDQRKVFAYVMANVERMNGAPSETPVTVAAMR